MAKPMLVKHEVYRDGRWAWLRRGATLVALALLALLLATTARAEHGPEWSYTVDTSVFSVAISGDGEYIAAGSEYPDKKVYLFDKDSSTPLWSYTIGHRVRSLALSADGEYIAAGSDDDKIYLFDKDSSTPLWSYTTGGTVWWVAISGNGEYITGGSSDNKVYLFEKDSSTPLWSYTTGDWALPVAISADGEYIVAGSKDKKVYLFDKDSSTPLWSYITGDSVVSVAISADGEYIAAGSKDKKVYLFDKDSSTPLWSYTTGDFVYSVAISVDGEYITAGSDDDKVYLFDKDSSTPLWSYTMGDDVYGVAISRDGKYIVAGSYDKKVYLFDKDSSTPLWSYTTGHWVSVSISADGEYIAAGSFDNNVYLFKNLEKPMAFIDSINPNSATEGERVTFNGSGTDPDGTIVAYEWRIDSWLANTSQNFSLDNLTIGSYNVSLRVQDDDGVWSEPKNQTLTITEPENLAPTGSIDPITPSHATEGEIITLNGSGTDPDGTIAAYHWRSSLDGYLGEGVSLSLNNLSKGEHIIYFWVVDEDGKVSAEVSQTLTIEAAPVADGDSEAQTFPLLLLGMFFVIILIISIPAVYKYRHRTGPVKGYPTRKEPTVIQHIHGDYIAGSKTEVRDSVMDSSSKTEVRDSVVDSSSKTEVRDSVVSRTSRTRIGPRDEGGEASEDEGS